LNLANLYCKEIHYRNRDKDYFSIGFRNDKDGYELSSPPSFKGCIAPKDITTIRNNQDSCLVFEGFWDFLSCLTIQKTEKSKHDVAVLNSVANVQKVMDFLKAHREVYPIWITMMPEEQLPKRSNQLAHPSMTDRSNMQDLLPRVRQVPT
jgi:hypothetical protein